MSTYRYGACKRTQAYAGKQRENESWATGSKTKQNKKMQNNGACVIVDDRYVSSWPIIRPSVPTRAESIMHGVSKGKRSARGAEALAVLNDRSTIIRYGIWAMPRRRLCSDANPMASLKHWQCPHSPSAIQLFDLVYSACIQNLKDNSAEGRGVGVAAGTAVPNSLTTRTVLFRERRCCSRLRGTARA